MTDCLNQSRREFQSSENETKNDKYTVPRQFVRLLFCCCKLLLFSLQVTPIVTSYQLPVSLYQLPVTSYQLGFISQLALVRQPVLSLLVFVMDKMDKTPVISCYVHIGQS